MNADLLKAIEPMVERSEALVAKEDQEAVMGRMMRLAQDGHTGSIDAVLELAILTKLVDMI